MRKHVLERYSGGAEAVQPDLCCPVDYDASLLEMLPQEIRDKDYGCGDPSRYVRAGDDVLDLGSGGGKVCYMAAQLTGPEGSVIGVDMNDDMLALARRYQQEMSEVLGGDRVRFCKGKIQDLALDMDAVDRFLADRPVSDSVSMQVFEHWAQEQRAGAPMIADESVDLVISNCVLNLVDDADRTQMIREIHRVLRPGGRVAISDIVADRCVPDHLKADPELWSGCISGAFHEQDFLQAFAGAGFHGASYDSWQPEAWRVVEDIEFRSVTLTASKPPQTAAQDLGQAALYLGPYASVRDDFGYEFPRGVRMAVSDRCFEALCDGPLRNDFVLFAPRQTAEPASACCLKGKERPAEVMGQMNVMPGKRAGSGCC